MNLQCHPPFLKVPWDWKEVASVSSLFQLLFFYQLGACHNQKQTQHVSKQGTLIIRNAQQTWHHAGVAAMADVILDSGMLGIANLS